MKNRHPVAFVCAALALPFVIPVLTAPARAVYARGDDGAGAPMDRNTELFQAACRDDLPRVRELLDQGANPNVRRPDPEHEGKTVGGLAALAGIGQGAILRELIARGADVNQDGGGGFTPLHAAALSKDEGLVVLLLAKGARVNARGSSGDTPLHAAALLGTPKTVKLLLDAGAKVNVQNGERNTPLMNAARMGSPETVRLLLARGADPNIHFESPFSGTVTALQIARTIGRQEVVALLAPVTHVGKPGRRSR